ncbi:MAG: arylesterase [Gammaproteobacteria bacterium]|jgi:lysophospholipase L1-like esterase|nr:arylesterase [Gammaproteobacteria bacterium]
MLRKLFLLFLLSTLFSCSDTVRLQPLSQDSIILAFGDSLTYGTGTSRDNAYPAVLERLTGRNVINAGVPGETSNRGLLRLANLIDQFQPDLIIICHGANDILRKLDLNRTRDNIQQMIDMARQNNSQVILIGVPEFNLFLDTSPIYQSLAEQNKIPLEENSLSNIIGNNALKSDHVHPNSDGYRVLAKNITSLLERSGAIQPLE